MGVHLLPTGKRRVTSSAQNATWGLIQEIILFLNRGRLTFCYRSGRSALQLIIFSYIYPAKKDYTPVYFPFLICFNRNTDRSALYSTIIRSGLNVKVDSYSLPPKNGFKAYNLLHTACLTTSAHNRHKRINFMKMTKQAEVGLLVFTITGSGLAMADCPNTMPEQLQSDCIVYEGAGSSFPTNDYAHMDQYKNWLKTQQPDQQNKISKSNIK
jgi:hypothetical protein